MNILPSLRSHAQNRFLRRINNREGVSDSLIGPRGSPIPGALTPTEIAHKARRKARRIEILKARNPDFITSNQAKLLGWD